MLLSRLNEINGGCEKILPVSGSVILIKFFRMIDQVYCMVVRVK